MKELISPAQANALFGIAPPILGVLLGGLLAAKKGYRLALLLGGPLILVGVLWWVYSAVTSALGLDTVFNLLVNAAIFLAVGVGAGLLWCRISPRPDPAPRPPGLGEAE